MGKENKKKSVFQSNLDKSIKVIQDKALPDEKRKANRLTKLEKIFENLGDKENRYLFYCPDIPFACSLVKVVYEHARFLTELGYNVTILHEVKGYKPNWLTEEWVKLLKVEYLSDKEKDGRYSKPSYSFKPTDTVIIPEGFWTVMQAFGEFKQVHKVVLALGYNGFATVPTGASWDMLGFTDVICVSEKVKEDYKSIWPNMNYHVVPYLIDTVSINKHKKELIEKEPLISLSIRSREDAQAIINIFYNRYPFLDMFNFKVLKKLKTNEYYDSIARSCALVLVDEKAGHPAPPLEAIALDTPTIAVYGRGLEHFSQQEGVLFITSNDNFEIAEAMAQYCLAWIDNTTEGISDKVILDNYSETAVKAALINCFEDLQESKVKLFVAIKNAVEEGKLEDAVFDIDEPEEALVNETSVQ